MEVTVQQKAISSGISTRYAYKAILDVILGMNKTEWECAGAAMMYYKDNYKYCFSSRCK
jgi:hypothetical protein